MLFVNNFGWIRYVLVGAVIILCFTCKCVQFRCIGVGFRESDTFVSVFYWD